MALDGMTGADGAQDAGGNTGDGVSSPEPGGLIGRTLGGYPLIGLLGVGGMAEVYRASDPQLKREVAVKVLPSALAKDASYVERFRAEAQRTAAFKHPNVVPVYNYGEEGGLLYIVMPVLESSVRDRLDHEGALEPMEAARLAYQVAAALDAAHRRGLVHRDVKPENILLGSDGLAKLTDFGIARELDVLQRNSGNQTLSVTGLPVGTPEYMAPEQLRGQPVDQRIDIYSLGIVFFEMLTGSVPFEAETPYAVAARVIKEAVPPPSSLNQRVWPALDVVVLNAVAKDPEERYANMRSFATDIRTAASRAGRTQPRWIALEKTSHPIVDATRLSRSGAEISLPLPASRGAVPSSPTSSPSLLPPSFLTLPSLAPGPTAAPMYVPGGTQPFESTTRPLYDTTNGPIPGYAGYAAYTTSAPTATPPERETRDRMPRLSLPVIAVLLLAVLVLGGIGSVVLIRGFANGGSGPFTGPGVAGHATNTTAGTPGHQSAATHSGGSSATATPGNQATLTPGGQATATPGGPATATPVGPTPTATTAANAHISVAASQVTLTASNCSATQTLTNDGSADTTWTWTGLPNGSAHLSYSINPRTTNTLTHGSSVTITISESAPCGGNSATVTVVVGNGGTATPASFTLTY